MKETFEVKGVTIEVEMPRFAAEQLANICRQWARRKLVERFSGSSPEEIEKAVAVEDLGEWLAKVAAGERVASRVATDERVALELLAGLIQRRTGVKKAEAMRKARELRAHGTEVWHRALERARKLSTEVAE